MDRGGRAREIVDLVDLDVERHRDVVAHEFELGMPEQVLDVALGAREKIVDAKDMVTRLDQAVGQMGADETGPAGDQDRLVLMHVRY